MTSKLVYPVVAQDGKATGGMTLREYVATAAMQGMIAAGEEVSTTRTAHAHRNQKLAQRAVEVADALIAELARGA